MLVGLVIRMRQMREVNILEWSDEPSSLGRVPLSQHVTLAGCCSLALLLGLIVVARVVMKRREVAPSEVAPSDRRADALRDRADGPVGPGTMVSLEKLLQPLHDPKLM